MLASHTAVLASHTARRLERDVTEAFRVAIYAVPLRHACLSAAQERRGSSLPGEKRRAVVRQAVKAVAAFVCGAGAAIA